MSEVQEGQHDQQQDQQHEQLERKLDEHYYHKLLELQQLDFALVELTLYLDTHPNDLQALQQFNQLAQQRQQVAFQFEMKYGPLLQFGHSFSRFPWQWSESPWPWQV
nr:spore coat protein CotJB [Paenibacillus curdlanolyticus]